MAGVGSNAQIISFTLATFHSLPAASCSKPGSSGSRVAPYTSLSMLSYRPP
jgi:hypothetical protein